MFFKDFTSHIVQIKPVKFPSEAVDERFIFTSHIVQIKHVVLNCRQVSKLLLYIPHSSDKTVEEPNVSEVWENFTSHIVQIKHI